MRRVRDYHKEAQRIIGDRRQNNAEKEKNGQPGGSPVFCYQLRFFGVNPKSRIYTFLYRDLGQEK